MSWVVNDTLSAKIDQTRMSWVVNDAQSARISSVKTFSLVNGTHKNIIPRQ